MKDRITENQLQLITKDKKLSEMIEGITQIRSIVKEKMKVYECITYTEDDIKEAKADRAMINKSSKALNDTRIELEKIYMQPFNKFKDVVKDTCDMLDLTSNSIDLQIKKFEQEEKDVKMKQIREYFDENNEYLVNFDRCFKSNWLNKNKGIAVVKAEINEVFELVEADFDKLKEHFYSEPCYTAIIDRYQNTLDYNNAYHYGVSLVNKALEAATAQNSPQPTYTPNQIQQPPKQPENNTQGEQVYIRAFKVKVTREQVFALADFMKANNIEFESIKL
ncbi:DUF1351 domain-containing protein [Clostridium sp.]|uniref:DUF1351 domain-containing protein n=1 Tax=Clostridium sp. TaxID=1506 RepID=UPI0025BD5876|nr:DUF1351 domain-containing protein [Clostridium sp.]